MYPVRSIPVRKAVLDFIFSLPDLCFDHLLDHLQAKSKKKNVFNTVINIYLNIEFISHISVYYFFKKSSKAL